MYCIRELRINQEIRAKEVRLIMQSGESQIISRNEAQRMAIDKEEDLVEVNGKVDPPVCKIMNYGKFKFEQSKREKESRKNQHVVELKELRLSPRISDHDLMVKFAHAKKFLESGNKVKIIMRFKGREISHADIGRKTMTQFAEICSDFATITDQPRLEGKQMFMLIVPKKIVKGDKNAKNEGMQTQKIQAQDAQRSQKEIQIHEE